MSILKTGTGKPRRGVSLYSYAGEFGVTMTLEDMFADIHDLGAPGLEILANAHIENYPEPSGEWVENWFRLLARYNLTPVEYGHWVDSRRYPGREMTTQESYDSLLRDIKLANRLGFPIMRTKLGVIDDDLTPVTNWREFISMALPDAEKYNVCMCPEIHNPTVLKSKMVDDYVEFIEKHKTRHFGLNIDFGVFQTDPIPMWEGMDMSILKFSPVEDFIPLLPYTRLPCQVPEHERRLHRDNHPLRPGHRFADRAWLGRLPAQRIRGAEQGRAGIFFRAVAPPAHPDEAPAGRKLSKED